MSVDPKIKEAIEIAVSDSNQPEGLARMLVRWFEAVAIGNEEIDDKQSSDRHLELLYREIQVPLQEDEAIAVVADDKRSPQ